MFILTLITWVYVFYALSMIYSTAQKNRCLEEGKETPEQKEEPSSIPDEDVSNKFYTFFVREGGKYEGALSVNDEYLLSECDRIDINGRELPLGRRKFRRAVSKMFDKDIVLSVEQEVRRIQWWNKTQWYVPMILYQPYLDVVHWIFMKKLRDADSEAYSFFTSKVDLDIGTRTWDALDWAEMWSHYFRGKGCTRVDTIYLE